MFGACHLLVAVGGAGKIRDARPLCAGHFFTLLYLKGIKKVDVLHVIFQLFVSVISHVVTAAPYICYFLVAVFIAVVLFNLLDYMMG